MITFFLKIAISCSLITWVLVYQVKLSELLGVVEMANIWLLLLAFSMHLIGFLFSGLRWQRLLKSQMVYVKLLPLIDSYLVGSFFNVFMPTRIGGDVVRVKDLRRATKSMSLSASSVFVERFLGISVLLFFALCASLIRLPLAKQIPAIWIGLSFAVIGLVLFLLAMFSQFISLFIGFIPLKKLRNKILIAWKVFRDNTVWLLSRREALVWGLWYSILLQLNVVIHFWVIGEALGYKIALLDYFFLIPIQLVILMLPTINGIGLREASSIVLFGFYGVGASQAAAFAFIDLAMMLAIGLIGWVRFLTRRSIPKNQLSKIYEQKEKI
ncbi:MAG: flippase-like domain-containing protein [Desulfobacteraceae bacterium]|nr:flippase-like domain-containing protein [Desulfobacteraceae bacterium]MBC2720383.1 flippase-like domain-containing protein [Desulfobacteraceae bacterium]